LSIPGRLPYSYIGVWRELNRAAAAAKIGHLCTHAFRHTYRSWLDACWDISRRSAKFNEAGRRHAYNDEHLQGCGYGRDGFGDQQSGGTRLELGQLTDWGLVSH
jgi:integrase